jgi:hypothetical protein
LAFSEKVKIALSFDFRSTFLNFDESVKVQVDLDWVCIDRAEMRAYCGCTSRLDGRSRWARKGAREESPGSTGIGCRVTPGEGDFRESATENKPPQLAAVRVKRWGKSPPQAWQQGWHGKPHPEQDLIGAAWGFGFKAFSGSLPGLVARSIWQQMLQMNGHTP